MWAPVSSCVSVAPWCMYRRIVLAKCCCDGRCARLKAAPCRACVSSVYHRDMELLLASVVVVAVKTRALFSLQSNTRWRAAVCAVVSRSRRYDRLALRCAALSTRSSSSSGNSRCQNNYYDTCQLTGHVTIRGRLFAVSPNIMCVTRSEWCEHNRSAIGLRCKLLRHDSIVVGGDFTSPNAFCHSHFIKLLPV